MFGSKDLLFTSETYRVAKSLRFRSGSTTYFNRTPSTTSGSSSQIYTWSGWVKLGYFNAGYLQAASGNSGGRMTSWYLRGLGGSGALEFEHFDGTTTYNLTTSAVFRDPSAWYHIVIAVDTPQATNTNRTKIYVNGIQQTVTGTYVLQSTNTYVNNATIQAIGSRNNASSGYGNYFDGYLAEVNFIDGQALTPSSFGFYDNNGIWQPKGYTGTYGTNGFYLKFTDVGATSGSNTGYGKDFSGFNTNYWTTNNFNSTSTSTSYDSMYDSPVNASNGITGIGNYCVMNPLDRNTGSLSDGNLTWVNGNASNYCSRSTIQLPSTGLWYAEATTVSQPGSTVGFAFGLATASASLTYPTANSYIGQAAATQSFYNGTSATTITAWSAQAAGDVFQVAYDATNNQVWFGKNNVWSNSTGGSTGNPSTGANPTITGLPANLFFFIGTYQNNSNLNFGQRPFAYTPPSGFSALNTQNLTTPTITNGAAYMAAVTYQGATAPNTVTTTSSNSGNNPNGVSFQPDLVWIKSRSAATDHKWTDAVRGTTKALVSNSTAAETTDTNGLTAFTASGFTVGSDTTYNNTTGPATYVAWEWIAGGAPTTDNVAGAGNVPTAGSVKINGANSTSTLAGSIAATRLSANTSAGFSVVTYTGTGANATVGHGLNATPQFMIIKRRNVAEDWSVYHSSLGATQKIFLDLTNAASTDATMWNNTAPTSSVYSIGTNTATNANTGTYVAYCWAPIAGFSAMGSYTGNGSTDGPFVYCGFRPRWVLTKRTDTAGFDWVLQDTSRATYNVSDTILNPNSSSAETVSGGYSLDVLSNGFKLRNSGGQTNASSGTYIYAAFAENPFRIARAR